jgi:branched-chain amino acid transport system permease protein
MRRPLIAVLAVVAALAALPFVRESIGISSLVLLTTFFFWTAQATSWNLLSGYAGYFSFGQGAFVGLGAYTVGVLVGRNDGSFWVALALAALLSAVLAALVGALAFRLRSFRGEIFALLTLAVPFILASVARLEESIDGGQGIIVPVPEFPDAVGGFQDFLYLLELAVAAVAVVVAVVIQHSRLGWALAAVRDAEDVAEGVGVPTFRAKMLALLATAVLSGASGAVFGLQIGFVTVEAVFGLTIPLFVIVMCVLGGRTHWLGPVLGAAIVVALQDRLATAGLEGWRLVILGSVLAVLVVVAPQGIVSLRPRGRLRSPRSAPAGSTDERGVVSTGATDESGEVSTGSTDGADEVLLEVRDVAKSFGGVRALRGVSLVVHSGEIVGLVGPNGSGKTTLVNLLSGSLRPTSGVVRVLGHDVRGLAQHRVVHLGVARTYQTPQPIRSKTARDNLAMTLMFGHEPRRLAEARAAAGEHLELVGLRARGDAYPSELTLHERQLLEMARAIAAQPRVLLLDEALAGLSPAEIDDAVGVVRRIHASGVTIVLVEHLLRVVNQLATRVVVLDRGERLADGDPATVMRDPAVVSAYLGRLGGRRAHA